LPSSGSPTPGRWGGRDGATATRNPASQVRRGRVRARGARSGPKRSQGRRAGARPYGGEPEGDGLPRPREGSYRLARVGCLPRLTLRDASDAPCLDPDAVAGAGAGRGEAPRRAGAGARGAAGERRRGGHAGGGGGGHGWSVTEPGASRGRGGGGRRVAGSGLEGQAFIDPGGRPRWRFRRSDSHTVDRVRGSRAPTCPWGAKRPERPTGRARGLPGSDRPCQCPVAGPRHWHPRGPAARPPSPQARPAPRGGHFPGDSAVALRLSAGIPDAPFPPPQAAPNPSPPRGPTRALSAPPPEPAGGSPRPGTRRSARAPWTWSG